MSVHITTFINGRWKQNCYIAANENGDALVIDPGSQADELISLIEKKAWRIHGIVNTHGHFDHIGAVVPLQERFRVPFFLHGSDEQLMKRANLFGMMFESKDPIRVPKSISDISKVSAKFTVGPFDIVWIATPGHTEGSVCLQIENYLFSGDTLMRDRIGRTDLPGGNRDALLASVRKLMSLPGDTVVYGGHGPATTITAEFAHGAKVWSLLQ